ncbi:FIST signal transduction protein [Flavivirga algicola]|uniref:Histidine kinase n=1 Tax=Flavivirga algicola TaxID=2729136 RepID=A0ABX1RWT9_9FLAO|nr:FIST N-terminal domain-containing protein [Flavivirga algicola]NMH88032.1 hypothetical protein [Flavivirga algicola]
MNVQQISLQQDNWQEDISILSIEADIFLLFVSPDFTPKRKVLDFINNKYPKTTIIGCSTAGEISDITVKDETISLTAIQLDKVTYKKAAIEIIDMNCSYQSGQDLAKNLYNKELKHVLVLSDGLNVNGAELVSGLKSIIPHVGISGGLAADGADFNKTFVVNDNEIVDKTIVALGFYGEGLKVCTGSRGGWDSYGIGRQVTKSNKNVLYELDGNPALDIYKSFLGEEAKNLPSSGLLFPLSMVSDANSKPLVRSILATNEDEKSVTFAGNLPEGAYVRFMKANLDRLIDGAEESAISASKFFDKESSELVILVSCVGRRMVLKQLVEEEVEAVRDVVGNKPCITGFYSYGEIGPYDESSPCELHNQTMSITTFSEC